MRSKISGAESLALLGPVCAVMVLGFLVPVGFIFFRSFTIEGVFTVAGFTSLFTSPLFIRVFWTTLEISLMASVVSIVVGYPVALFISRQPEKYRSLYLIMVLFPFWTSILVKSFAFVIILGHEGVINAGLRALGLQEFEMIFNRFGVLVGSTNYLIPFAVFPILTNLLSQDANLLKAAEVMGAGPLRIFWRITFPLTAPGVSAAFVLTFVLSLGLFATPALLGGRRDMMMANLIDFYTRDTLNWNAASAVAVILLLTSAVLLVLVSRISGTGKPA
ncbi:ABC transporter permease [Agaricicola taiwanensis]|uniref:ABC transporter permease n=1 Tax=Agaricicola taiwanensis TaxID=591372 RepID=UPI001E2CB5E1|nr:ABC transporter permease [Agaricicola taiwanensis]